MHPNGLYCPVLYVNNTCVNGRGSRMLGPNRLEDGAELGRFPVVVGVGPILCDWFCPNLFREDMVWVSIGSIECYCLL